MADGKLLDCLHGGLFFLYIDITGFGGFKLEFECAVFGGVCDFDGEE